MDVYYIHPSEDDLRADMDKYTAWLDGEIAKVNQSVNQEEQATS